MSQCGLKNDFLDGRLSEIQKVEFLSHLSSCEECAGRVGTWHNIRGIIDDNAVLTRHGVPGAQEINALLVKAREGASVSNLSSMRHPVYSWSLRIAVAASTAAIAAILFFAVANDQTKPFEQPPAGQLAVVEGPKIIESSAEQGRSVEINRSGIRMMPSSRLLVLKENKQETRLKVDRGSVQFEVEKRAPGARFVVEAGSLTVSVVGTQFTVGQHLGDYSVYVTQGVVAVDHKDGRDWRVAAGQVLALNSDGVFALENAKAALDDKAPIVLDEVLVETTDTDKPRRYKGKPIDMDALTREVMKGCHNPSVSQDLKRHLERHRSDHSARMLLANCYRKQSNWGAALSQYEKVIKRGSDAKANEARYLSAKIYATKQKRHRRAAAMYEQFIKHTNSSALLSEARLGLAQSLVLSGKKRKAQRVYCEITDKHGASTAAVHARRYLKKAKVECD